MSQVKILLCDDDPDLLGLLVRRLKKMGIEPDAASDGREAKSLIDANRYDVIVADIYMPEASGLEVMQHAKQNDADTQVVIITSSATLDNAIDALNHGAFGYLTKPFDHLIVFENMVSRALEYRMLVVADKRKAEAQRRRGDMLEEEVAQRVRQLQKTQKGLLDLLGSLPDGILVVEHGGKVVLSSPIGERWLAQDQKTENRPIQAFINQVHAEMPEPSVDVTIDGVDLHLMLADLRDDGEVKRKAIIIREVEEDGAGEGSLVTEAIMGIKKGLAMLYEQGLGTEVVLNVACQFAVLEQLQGWSGGTGELAAAGPAPAQSPAATVSSPAPARATQPEPAQAPVEPAQPEPAPAQAPAESAQPKTAPAPAQEQSPAPVAPMQTPAESSEAEGVTSTPPFAIPRERTPTGELDGPRLNTSELQDALRASAPGGAQQAAAEPPRENSTPPENVADSVETQASQTPIADPMAETLISGAKRELEGSEEIAAPAEKVAPAENLPAVETQPPVEAVAPPEGAGPVKAAAPAPSDAQALAAAPVEQAAHADPVEEATRAAPAEAPTPSPPLEVETSLEPDTQPAELAAPIPIDLTPAPPWEDPELSSSEGDPAPEPDAFPGAEAGTDDFPSLIEGIEGITDPDLLASFRADFGFDSEQPDASFPEAQTGELLDDDSRFRPRVIPEEMNAELQTPAELPKTNGIQEYAAPPHDGPITIQASQADTQVFRKVLAGLSGTEILSGDYEKPEEELPKSNGDTTSKPEEGLNELRAEFSEAPARVGPDVPIEAPQAEVPPPVPEDLRTVPEPEPEPQPVQAAPATWPPTLPTKDDDWDDQLDVSG
ncbi:MAG: response regulator [Anaerolineales bacterium]